jgi:hypothetical protein
LGKEAVEKKKPTRKISVQFEMEPQDVKELIASGNKRGMKLSDVEFEKLSREGVIKASDYLDQEQMEVVAVALPSWIKKAGSKIKKAAVTALSSPEVQKTVVSKVTTRSIEEGSEETEMADKPKD